MTHKIIRKVFLNKKNKQLMVTLPKKEIRAIHPTIKFGEDLFVELRILKRSEK